MLEVTVRSVANHDPTATISGDVTIPEGTQADLIGTAADSDGTISTYAWTANVTGGTFGSDASANTTYTAPAVEADTPVLFTLTVTDDDGGTGTATHEAVVTDSDQPAVAVVPPEFSSATLDVSTGVLEVEFDGAISAASIEESKFRIIEAGATSGGVTLTAAELDTKADPATVAFTLTAASLQSVKEMAVPGLVVHSSAVKSASGGIFGPVFDVSEAAHANSLGVSSRDATPTGLAFSADGTKMFVAGTQNDSIYEYALSTAFDVSSATHADGDALDVSSQDTDPQGVAFSADGTKMFVVGYNTEKIHEYALSTAFDVSSATHADGDALGVSSQGSNPQGVAFSADGRKMFVAEETSTRIHEYALSAAFDVSSATHADGDALDVSSQDIVPTGVAFSADGTKMFVAGFQTKKIHEYALSAAFDVSSATHTDSLDVSSQDDRLVGVAFSADGTKMFVVGDENDSIHEYAMISKFEITLTGADAFVTTWRTTSPNETITLPISGSGMTIDWGDGNKTKGASDNEDHTYADTGDYSIRATGDLQRIAIGDYPGSYDKIISLDQWGNASWTTMSYAFSGASNMAYRATDVPDLSRVTDMSYMFQDASSFNGNVSSWNVSQVTTMYSMFQNAAAFNQTLNSWDVSSVAEMGSMFQDAAAFNQPLNSWDVSSVAEMGSMFQDAAAFNQPLNSWDVSSVTDMSYMFQDAAAFNQPLNSWDVSSVTAMYGMFTGAASFKQNLGNWYIVLPGTAIDRGDVPGIVGTISAQNYILDSQVSTYNITAGLDSSRFGIAGDNRLNMVSADAKGSYRLNVTASGSDTFGTGGGHHHRVLNVTVRGAADTTPPTPTVSSDVGTSGSVTGTAEIPFSVSFSETVTGFTSSDISLGGTGSPGSVTGFDGSGAGPYNFTVTAGADGTVTVTVPADSAVDSNSIGNSEAGPFTVTHDGTDPVPTITSDAGASGSVTGTAEIPFSVSFSETVTGFTSGDVTVAGTGTPGTVAGFAGTGAGPYNLRSRQEQTGQSPSPFPQVPPRIQPPTATPPLTRSP